MNSIKYFVFLIIIIIWFNKSYCDFSCYFCHLKFQTSCNEETLHPPVAEEKCLECHKEHGRSNKLILKDTIQEICSQCHEIDKESFKNAHFNCFIPINTCIKCHDPHILKNKKQLKSLIHTAFKNGKCFECHKKNSDSTILTLPINKLCFKCHALQTKQKKIYYHEPYIKGKCTVCHDPHISKNLDHLKESTGQMCIENCHETKRKDVSKHQQIKTRKCLDCHTAHFSYYKNLLKIELSDKNQLVDSSNISPLCYRCHKQFENNIDLHEPVKEGQCNVCHKLHLINNHTQFKQEVLCNKCHLKNCKKNELCNKCHEPHYPKKIIKDSYE